jgi:hypothetical protein
MYSISEASFGIFLIGVLPILVKPIDLEPKLATYLGAEPINHSIYVFSQNDRRNFSLDKSTSFPIQGSVKK